MQPLDVAAVTAVFGIIMTGHEDRRRWVQYMERGTGTVTGQLKHFPLLWKKAQLTCELTELFV